MIADYQGGFIVRCALRFTALTFTRPADTIERQLAHTERDEIRDAYNRAEYLTERSAH